MSEAAPRALKYARIVAALAVSRLIGFIFLTAPSTTIPTWYSTTFAAGDVLTGIFALPVAWALGRGGVRTYALAVAWSLLGFFDLVYAVSIATQSGVYSGVSSFLGAGIVVLPVAMVVQFVVFVLLMSPSVARYMARKSTSG